MLLGLARSRDKPSPFAHVCADSGSLLVLCPPASQSVDFMSRELVWKMHFEIARLEDRVAELCTLVEEELGTSHSTTSSCSSPRRRSSTSDYDGREPAVLRPTVSPQLAPLPPSSSSSLSSSVPCSQPLPSSTPPTTSTVLSPLLLSSPSVGVPLPLGLPGPASVSASASPPSRPSSRLGSHAALDIAAALAAVLPPGFVPTPLGQATPDAVGTEREMCMIRAREAYARSAIGCPLNLRWKVWLAGARSELGFGKEAIARRLLDRASAEVWCRRVGRGRGGVKSWVSYLSPALSPTITAPPRHDNHNRKPQSQPTSAVTISCPVVCGQ